MAMSVCDKVGSAFKLARILSTTVSASRRNDGAPKICIEQSGSTQACGFSLFIIECFK